MAGIGAFRILRRRRLIIKPYSPLKPTKVGFIFIGPNFLSRAWVEDFLNGGFKELSLEPKFLKHGLRS